MNLRLRTAFLVGSLGGLWLLVLGIWAFADSYRVVTRISEIQQAGGALVSGGRRLTQHAHNLLLYPQTRQIEQWRRLSRDIAAMPAEQGETLHGVAREVAAVETYRRILDRQLAEHITLTRAPGDEAAWRMRLTQITLRIAELNSALDELEQAIHQAAEEKLGTSGKGLVAKFTLIFGLYILISLVAWGFFYLRMLRPLSALEKSICRIRDGETTFRPVRTAADELGAVVEAFNDLLDRQQAAERQLVEAEELFRTVTQFSGDWSYWRSEDGRRFLYNSPNCERITGYSPAAFEADPGLLDRILHPEDRRHWREHFGEDTEPHPIQEYRLLTRTGEVRWISHTCRQVQTADGRPRGWRGSNHDITKSKEIALQMESLARDLAFKNRLFQVISHLQEQFIREPEPALMFDGLLQDVIALTDSEYGLVGDVLQDGEGRDYLKCYAFSNIAWDEETRRFYEENKRTGFVFKKLDNLFGQVITGRAPVLANDPARAPGHAGIPSGHPELRAFLGIPVWYGERLVGEIGLANRPGGYDQALLDQIQPVVEACGRIIVARWERDARQRAEAELRESETRFRTLFNSSGDAVLVHPLVGEDGRLGRFLEANEAALERYGYLRQELFAMTLMDLDEPGTGPAAADQERVQHLAMPAGNLLFERMHVAKDGRRIPVEISSHLFDLHGVKMVLSLVRDITERRRVQAELERYRHHLEERVAERTSALHESNRRLSEIQFAMDRVGIGIHWVDAQTGRLRYVNDAACAMLGYSRDEMLNLSVPDLDPSFSQGRFDELAARLRTEGQARLETLNRGKDGHSLPVEVTCYFQEKAGGGTGQYIAFVTDIRQRKQVEAERIQAQEAAESAHRALQINESRLNAMLALSESAPERNERDLLQHGLEEAERLTGSRIGYLHLIHEDQQSIHLYTWSRNTLNHCTATHDTHYPIAKAGIWADTVRLGRPVRHNDYPSQAESRGYPEGHAPLLRHMAVPILEGTRVRMILGVGNKPTSYDEADLRQLQLIGDSLWKMVSLRRAMTALAAARDAAEAANRAKSTFLANMSHELRTPLNAILGFAQLMEHDDRIPAEERRNIATINRSGNHLLALINDVLEISRIEAGRTRVKTGAFDLEAALLAVEEMIRGRAEAKRLAFRIAHHGKIPPYVLGDAHHLRQVLINLLGNAVKYTDQGHIALDLYLEENDRIRFVVSDTGFGIAPKDQEKIFQAFYQTEAGIAKGEGTGLGLTISAEFVRLMGGRLQLDSALGRGSTFYFSLPLRPTAAVSGAGDRRRVLRLAPGQAAPRLLVVEDHPDNRIVIERMLGRLGGEVRVVADGQQAVESFQTWNPELIVMDMRMPVLDGYAATRAIRALPGGEQLPIVALTASVFQEDVSQVMAAGCNELVKKPVEESQLFEVIGRLLELRFEYKIPEAQDNPKNTDGNLDRLPEELCRELAGAAESLDAEAIAALIARLRASHSDEADLITQLVEDFHFDRLLELCERTASPAGEATEEETGGKAETVPDEPCLRE